MSHLSSEASPSRGPSWLARATAVVAVTGLALIGTSVAAEAHVTVDADSTASGSFSALTFRVPNESDTAGTVKVTTEIPQDTPLVYVSIRPVPGWKATTAEEALPKPITAEGGATITKAIRTITWTAEQGTQIAPGEYQEFSISAGPLPEAGTVVFPTTQLYSDGKEVAWDEPTRDSGEEPERPAPALVVTAAEGDAGPESARPPSGGASSSEGPSVTENTTTASSSDGVARGLAGAGLGVAVLAAVLAGLGLRRRSGPA